MSNSFGGGLITICASGILNVVSFWGFWIIALMEDAVEDLLMDEELAPDEKVSLRNGSEFSMKVLQSDAEDICFGRVDGGEFWNLHVDVEAVVDPEEEDDCKEVEEKWESTGGFEIIRDVSWAILLLLPIFIELASASCIRHNPPGTILPSCVEPSIRFKVDFILVLSLFAPEQFPAIERHLDEWTSVAGKFLGRVEETLPADENTKLLSIWLPMVPWCYNWNKNVG